MHIDDVKNELFKKYNVVLDEKDPALLIYDIHKNLTDDIIKATKNAQKSVDTVKKSADNVVSSTNDIKKILSAYKNSENAKNIFCSKKAIFISSFLALIIGGLSVGGYFYADKQNFDKAKLQTVVRDFTQNYNKNEMPFYSYAMVDNKHVLIDGYMFHESDVVNGWSFHNCYLFKGQKYCVFSKAVLSIKKMGYINEVFRTIVQ